jgi:hypothetical protein
MKHARTVGVKNNAKHLTFLPTICADAAITFPFFFIYAAVMLGQDVWWDTAPDGSKMVCSKNGSMEKAIFRQYIEWLVQQLKQKGQPENTPYVLFLDGCSPHFDAQAFDVAAANNLHLIAYPAHCTHKLQPLDVRVFGPFKSKYNDLIASLTFSGNVLTGKERPADWVVRRQDLVECTTKAWQVSATPEAVVCVLA